jgi:apolipoprotein N-acyltransferase
MFAYLYVLVLNLGLWHRVGLSILLGALSALALPPWYFLPLIIPAFTGFLWLIDAAARSPNPLSRSATIAWLFGFGHFVVGMHWIAEPFLVDATRHSWLIPFVILGLSGGLAFFIGITGLLITLFTKFFHLSPIARVLLFSVFWVIMEWVRSWLFSGFPWNLIGYVWSSTTEVMQVAAFIGVLGISLVTVMAAGMSAILGITGGCKSICIVLFFTVFLPIMLWGAGALRLETAPDYLATDGINMVPEVSLRIVQANISQDKKWKAQYQKSNLQRHILLSKNKLLSPPTHVIWPEATVPPHRIYNGYVRSAVKNIISPGGALITGAVRRGGVLDKDFWNSVYFINDLGINIAFYDKSDLVPFGEYVPFRSILPIDKLVPGHGDFLSGVSRKTIKIKGLPPVSPLICYEGIFPGRTYRSDARPDWLLSLTNDAWFGTYAGPQQHFAITIFRSIEEGLPLVRAANTGISAIVDPYGRIIKMLDVGVEGVINSGLPLALPRLTLYAKWGNATSAGAIGLVIILIILLQILHLKFISHNGEST